MIAKKLGDTIGEFIRVDCDQEDYCWGGGGGGGDNLRIKILIDITWPLRRGIKVQPFCHNETSWIDIRYERLPELSYACGSIGHSAKECVVTSSSSKSNYLMKSF